MPEGFINSEEAARKLGYEITHFRRMLSSQRVRDPKTGAPVEFWHGYLIPENITSKDIVGGYGGRQKMEP